MSVFVPPEAAYSNAITADARERFPAMEPFTAINLPVRGLSDGQRQRAYIVGCGPNGRPYVDRIPRGSFTIALNGAVTYNRRFSAWVAYDHQCCVQPWWYEAAVPFHTVKVFGSRLVNRLAREQVGAVRILEPHHYFDWEPVFTRDDLRLLPNVLRGGLTVAGCAIQLAVYAGVTEIVLVGCDFYGWKSFDGSLNKRPECKRAWPWARMMAQFCRELKREHGVSVFTASPSALKLPRWRCPDADTYRR